MADADPRQSQAPRDVSGSHGRESVGKCADDASGAASSAHLPTDSRPWLPESLRGGPAPAGATAADADSRQTDARPPDAAFDAWFCPDCGHGLASTEADPFLLRCDRCDKQFEVSAEDREELIGERPAGRDEELDGLRIRQFAAGRRAAYRARSYAVIATTVCVVAAGQLAWYALDHARQVGLDVWPFAYGVGALLALLGGVFFARKTLDLHRETRQPPPKPPEAEPDFSTLSDGSQHWRNLEEMR